jgi:hypothetical protein
MAQQRRPVADGDDVVVKHAGIDGRGVLLDE